MSNRPTWPWKSRIQFYAIIPFMCLGTLFLIGCGKSTNPPLIPSSPSSPETQSASVPIAIVPSSEQTTYADVLSVEPSADPGMYRFSVTIQSPDTGCDQYANWWEVVSEDGTIIHRRILLHSHVNEQPFSRSSGPVEINANQTVIVRAHMHPSGYGGKAVQGSVADGFRMVNLADDFATDLASQPPLPTGCNF